MQIRPATDADWSAIWAAIAPTIRAGATYALPRHMSEADARAYWCGPDRDVFVAEIDGLITGSYFLRANQAGPGAHVSNAGYIVHPRFAGRGVATALCAHSLEEARARGFRAMQFNFVVSSNVRAVRLWQHMGFAIVGTLPGAFAHPDLGFVDAYVMFRSLTDD
jgi:ribosomal protein S18 acetylase RimI-like enzyme